MRDIDRDDDQLRWDDGAAADTTLVAATWDDLGMARGGEEKDEEDGIESGDSDVDVVLEGEDDEDDLDEDDDEEDDDDGLDEGEDEDDEDK